jgi:hypothetical protein
MDGTKFYYKIYGDTRVTNNVVRWLVRLNGLSVSQRGDVDKLRDILYRCYYTNGYIPKGHIDWVQRYMLQYPYHFRYQHDNIESCVTMDPYPIPFMYSPLSTGVYHLTTDDIIAFARNLGITVNPGQDSIVDITNYINDMLYYKVANITHVT